jgi:ribosomal protein L21
MFAIVEIQGKQYRVSPQQKIIVDKQDHDVGSKIILNNVLLFTNISRYIIIIFLVIYRMGNSYI